MDLLIIPVPLFDESAAVEAYYFRHQKGNDILEPSQGPGLLDGAMLSPPLQTLEMIGLEAFTMGKPIFIPINNFMLLTSLELQCSQPSEKIIFLVDGDVNMEDPYLENMKRLRQLGYQFAIQKFNAMEPYRPALDQCSFVFIDYRTMEQPEIVKLGEDLAWNYRELKIVYSHVPTMEAFGELKKKTKGLYEGRFYRTPLTKGQNKVTPLQVNQISLMNMVRDDNFEFEAVAKIIQRDTAMTIHLLRLVNSPYLGLRNKVKNISHAVTMLGQEEVRKWITTAVAKMLGSEKPSEITRLSLVRARFCEMIAPKFGMQPEAQGLFLMGLFSVLDAILELQMDEALKMVHVSDAIRDALVDHKGQYYAIYDFMLNYEAASWKTISRQLIINDITTDELYEVYTGALCWYRDLIDEEV